MLESDFIYFHHESDEFARILSEGSSSFPRKKPRFREESSSSKRMIRPRPWPCHGPRLIGKYIE
jgi:hypothetical protein